MFKILSKESNIFSIPAYCIVLLLMVIIFNVLNFNTLGTLSAIITFAGIALGYFCFHAIGLTYQTHLPLMLYTFFTFAFYPGSLDIGLAVTILTNSFLVLMLTNNDLEFRKKSNVLVGAILTLNFIFLPATWPLIFFVIIHIIATSERIGLQIFRLLFGVILVLLSYFSVMYFLDFRSLDNRYFPFNDLKIYTNLQPLLYLIPVAALLVYSVFDHFLHFNKKSPVSKFKYNFLLIFSLAQLITIILYMGNHYEFLMLLALPASVILSRFLRFVKKPWFREVGLWVIIFSLIAFKLTYYISN